MEEGWMLDYLHSLEVEDAVKTSVLFLFCLFFYLFINVTGEDSCSNNIQIF